MPGVILVALQVLYHKTVTTTRCQFPHFASKEAKVQSSKWKSQGCCLQHIVSLDTTLGAEKWGKGSFILSCWEKEPCRVFRL